jgi:hypothetical protein
MDDDKIFILGGRNE